jgi:aminoglycoside phosphotransferase family enzyme
VDRILDPDTGSRSQALARRFVAGRVPLFRERIDHGHVCDGHGDLQADDIFCLADGPRVLDGLELDEWLRIGDVAVNNPARA